MTGRKKSNRTEQVRKLLAQGKLTTKQIVEKTGAPASYIYVLRSKMKAAQGGIASVADIPQFVMPVATGIRAVERPTEITVVEEPKPSLLQRIVARVRTWMW